MLTDNVEIKVCRAWWKIFQLVLMYMFIKITAIHNLNRSYAV